MAGIPIVIVAYFFGGVSWAWSHAWLVVPALVVAWLLLFVPSSTWARIRSTLVAPLRRSPRMEAPAVSLHKRDGRELIHSR